MAMYKSDGLRISTYKNGDTPYIKDGNWYIGDRDLEIRAEGKDGKDGISASPVYVISLSNDNATIGTNADGNGWNEEILKTVSTINVSVYEGEENITPNCEFDWSSNGCTLVESNAEGASNTCRWLTSIEKDSATVTIMANQISPNKNIGFKVFTITKQKQGNQGNVGPQGPKGNDGTGVNVKASREECKEIGDSYIDADGNLMILTTLPDNFTNGGQIKGPKGDKGTSSFLHVAYADSSTGDGFSDDPTGKSYIGTYLDEIQADSDDPDQYTWTKWEGDAAITYVLSISPNSWNQSETDAITPTFKVTKYVGDKAIEASAGEYLIKGKKGDIEYSWPDSSQWPENKITESTIFNLYVKDDKGALTVQADSETITANKNGAPGNDGRGINSTTISYAVTDKLVDPSNIFSWVPQSEMPAASSEQYLWTKTIIDYTTGDDSVSYTYSYQGKTGAAGTSVTVESIEYQAGSSATSTPTGTWSPSIPTVSQGQYLWSKTTFSDGKVAYGVSYQSIDGDPAQDFNITADSYVLSADENGNIKSDSKITLTAHVINIDDAKVLWSADDISWTSNHSLTYEVGAVGTYYAKIEGTDWKDSITIGKIQDGATGPDGKPAIAIMLTNPTMTFHASTANEEEYCEVIVYEGGDKLTQAASGDGTFSIAEKTDTLNKASIVNGKIKISDPSSDGSATFTVTVRPKSKAAATTQDYTIYWTVVKNGDNAKDLNLLADSYFFVKKKDGTVEPSQINFTTQSSGLTGNYTWNNTDNNSSTTSSNILTYSDKNTYPIIVTVSRGGLTDSITIGYIEEAQDGNTPEIKNGYWYIGDTNLNIKAEGQTPTIANGMWYIGGVSTGVKAQGEDAIGIMLTNPSMTFNSSTPTSETCSAIVMSGTTTATYSKNAPGQESGWKYTLSELSSGISVNENTGEMTISGPSSNTAETVTITVYHNGSIKKSQTFNIHCTVVDNGVGTKGASSEGIKIYCISTSLTPPDIPNSDGYSSNWSVGDVEYTTEKIYKFSCRGTKETSSDDKVSYIWEDPILCGVKGLTEADLKQFVTFNELTKNGQNQGIYYQDKELYINAKYIRSGVLEVIGEEDTQPLFRASISNPAVWIAGWDVQSNSIKTGDIGKPNSMYLSPTGITYTGSIGGSGSNQNWCVAIGQNYGVTDEGKVYAAQGQIAGWTIVGNGIYKTKSVNGTDYSSGLSSTANTPLAFWAGRKGTSLPWSLENYTNDTNFYVTQDGYMYAKNAKIEGEIIAEDGTIGGWHIDKVSLTSTKGSKNDEGKFKYSSGLQCASNGDWAFAVGNLTQDTWNYANFKILHSGECFADYLWSAENDQAIYFSNGIAYFYFYNDEKKPANFYITPDDLMSNKYSEGVLKIGRITNDLGNGMWYLTDSSAFSIGLLHDQLNYKQYLKFDYPQLTLYDGQSSIEMEKGTITLNAISTNLEYESSLIYLNAKGIYFDGKLWIGSSISDSRRKHSIEQLPQQYEVLFDKLRPTRYKYIDGTSNRYHTGFIAQEVVSALEESGLDTLDFAAVVLQDPGTDNELWQLRRDEFVALNTWQIQKLKPRLTATEKKIEQLESEVSTLKSELENLKKLQNSDIIIIEETNEVTTNDNTND